MMELDNVRIAALGDSITAGYLCEEKNNWVTLTAQELKIEIVNLGICGDGSRDLWIRFPQVISIKPAYCIILGGANDAFFLASLEDYSRYIKKIVEACQENGINPIIGIPTPSLAGPEEKLLRKYREWLKKYAEEKGLWVIDFYTPLVDMQGETYNDYFIDEVHPNTQGYKKMAEAAKDILVKIIKDN